MVDLDDVRRGHGFYPLRVKAVVAETADARSFVLDVPGELRDEFRYEAGQFCTFRVSVDGVELLRSYSMSSAPEVDDDVAVTVKRVPGGPVSNWFNDQVRAGDVLEVTRPAGVFCVPAGGSPRPVVAFCGGSGVTPVISIAKRVLATDRRAVRLLYANRDRSSVIFDAELERLRVLHPDRLEVRHHYDADAGFLDGAAVAAFVAGGVDADFYVCGPGPFMDLVEEALDRCGVDPGRVRIERFADAGRSGSGPAPAVDDAAAGGVPATVTLMLNGRKSTVAYQAGDTVLETARRGGLRPPYSCEAGDCATCMAVLREGRAVMRVNNALTEDEVADGWILTCQALPQGPDAVTVEYEAL
jgi:ferredoxin-NADP reductase